MRSTVGRIAAAALAATAIVAAMTVQAGASTTTDAGSAATAGYTGPTGTSEFRGVNWADPRDNYADDAVVPPGWRVTDDYRTAYRKAIGMVRGFQQELGANTLRLPINPASVGHHLVEVVPRRDRRGHGLRRQGHRQLLGGQHRQGRPGRRHGRLEDHVGHRGRRSTATTRGCTSSR